jgi:trans-aconitate methyltransferase
VPISKSSKPTEPPWHATSPAAISHQTWDPTLYDGRHAFVYQLAGELLNLLAAQPAERIVDLGCGTGHLTARIAEAGADVLGLDMSPAMIEQARANFPRLCFAVADATSFTVSEPVDAVLSNATLHWVQPPEAAVARIAAALKPGGRFVAEFGGRGCVQAIIEAANGALDGRFGACGPWYFPSVGQYTPLLEGQGLEVRFATLFDRPTVLDDGERGLRNWIAMFAGPFFATLPDERREATLRQIEATLRPRLWKDDHWVADYRRIRLVAVKL